MPNTITEICPAVAEDYFSKFKIKDNPKAYKCTYYGDKGGIRVHRLTKEIIFDGEFTADDEIPYNEYRLLGVLANDENKPEYENEQYSSSFCASTKRSNFGYVVSILIILLMGIAAALSVAWACSLR